MWEGKPYWKGWMGKFLKRAGDPQWETWQPSSQAPANAFQVNREDWERLLTRLCPELPQAWDYAPLSRAKAERTIAIPRPCVAYGSKTRYWAWTAPAELVGETDQEAWVLTPGVDRWDGGNDHQDHRLYRLRGTEATQVPWPTPAQMPQQPPGGGAIIHHCVMLPAGSEQRGEDCPDRHAKPRHRLLPAKGWNMGRTMDQPARGSAHQLCRRDPCLPV